MDQLRLFKSQKKLRYEPFSILRIFLEVLRYHVYNVIEQILFFFAFGTILGRFGKEMSETLELSNYMKYFLISFFVTSLWLVQERIAILGFKLKDPMTRRVISSKPNVPDSITTAVKRDDSSTLSQVSTTSREEEVVLKKPTDIPAERVKLSVYERILDPKQESLVVQLIEKYFSGSNFSKSRFLCVNDDPRSAALRALVARNWKFDQACVLIEKNLNWREKLNVDNIFLKVLPPAEVLNVRIALGDGFYGTDRRGNPIYWCPAGICKICELKTLVPNLEHLLYLHVQVMEYNQRVWFKELSQAQNRTIFQTTVVLDLKGFTTATVSGSFHECMTMITDIENLSRR